jgi:N-acetylglucosaminyldiphosphoundecaprenol N-acetyl-beta-D-mannosaminyltransferase
VGILLRSLPAFLLCSARQDAPREARVLGIRFDNLTVAEAVAEIVRRTEAAGPSQVCFLNAHCVNLAGRDAEYRETLRSADLALPDGIGLRLAGKMLGYRVRENVNGTDLFPALCQALSGSGKGIYLLGARPGIAEQVARWLASHYPDVDVRGSRHGYFSAAELDGLLDDIRRSEASVLLVALGAPRQDLWIRRHLARTGVKVALGVGGLFDFYSGRIPRAPMWLRELGLEWLYRLIQEPGRLWRRYLVGNLVFLARVVRDRSLAGSRTQALCGEQDAEDWSL